MPQGEIGKNKKMQSRLPSHHQPRKPEQDQDHYCDHNFQVRQPFALFLFYRTFQATEIAATRWSNSTTFSIRYTHGRTGFAVPQTDIDAIVVWRQPAFCAVFPPAVLAGEREHNFVSAAIAPGHYFSIEHPGINDSP
jgi:hypothetical protein